MTETKARYRLRLFVDGAPVSTGAMRLSLRQGKQALTIEGVAISDQRRHRFEVIVLDEHTEREYRLFDAEERADWSKSASSGEASTQVVAGRGW